MISEDLKNKIKNLFIQKKYEEVIEITEKFTLSEERPSGLINLLGISYYSKRNPSEQDIKKALYLFESAYLGEKNSVHGLNAIKNLVIVGIKTSNIDKEYLKYLDLAKKYYLEASNSFDKNEEFLQTGILLFTHLLDKERLKEIINKIIYSSINSKDLRGQSTFLINYFDDWLQKDIIDISKQNKKYFSTLNVKKINGKKPNDQKIRIGFVSCDLLKNHSVLYFLKDTIRYLDNQNLKFIFFLLIKKISTIKVKMK